MASTNVVNLDALIPREDFSVDAQGTHASALEKISVVHLVGPFFGPDLRKPDFQRETTQWTPVKVADLVKAFVDLDLIPAVILWRAGSYVFVIDGTHRLSALIAWILDDYGDRKKSIDFFGGRITDEQRKVAERTRKLINKTVGSYQDYLAARDNPEGAPANIQKRLTNLSVNAITAQWVATTDVDSAEASFFKINQAATPIEPTERRLLKSRHSASAIATRAITHAGTGHKYWSAFDRDIRDAIESSAKSIYHALYDPPISSGPLTTLDVPVAGRGYNAVPFIFYLVNQSNGVDIADTTSKRVVKDKLEDDPDGNVTLQYLDSVRKRIERITGDAPASLGVHPVVYFYTRAGLFQPTALLATSLFLENLAEKGNLNRFTDVRKDFEEFLILHKESISLLTHKFGSGDRSLPWIYDYYNKVAKGLWAGKGLDDIQNDFALNPDYAFLTAPRPSGARPPSTKLKHPFSAGTKTAAFFAAALPGGTRCRICGALVHKNSVQFDHKVPVRDGGPSDASNAQVAHPYCNSTVKG